jgi:hypothetical protein
MNKIMNAIYLIELGIKVYRSTDQVGLWDILVGLVVINISFLRTYWNAM